MLNIIKMDLYRMFRTKSLYIIWLLMALMLIFSTYMSSQEYDMTREQAEELTATELAENSTTEPVNIGFSVVLPTQPGEEITAFDLFYAIIQSKFMALFLVIFAVMFSTADMNSGFIKCIGGQVKNRGSLVFSKAVSLTLYTVLSMIIILIIQILSQGILLGSFAIGDISNLAAYTLSQTTLHIALVLISMTISILIRNNVISMTIVICLCMNLTSVLYIGLQKLIEKMGIVDFILVEYTVTGNISMLSRTPEVQDCVKAILVAAVFGIAMTAIARTVFSKRDL